MLDIEFPYLTTVLSALFAFGLGVVWYHPKIMGQKWMLARGKASEQMSIHPKQIVFSFLLWLLTACFYSFMIGIADIEVPSALFMFSCLLWVAFAMPPILMGALYTGYSFEAVAIDAGYHLAGYYILAGTHIFSSMIAI